MGSILAIRAVGSGERPLQGAAGQDADQVAAELGLQQPALPAPHAVGYRVGGPAPCGGRFLAVWRRGLAVGEPLPPMQLPLTTQESVEVDLEGTYRRAAEAAYLG